MDPFYPPHSLQPRPFPTASNFTIDEGGLPGGGRERSLEPQPGICNHHEESSPTWPSPPSLLRQNCRDVCHRASQEPVAHLPWGSPPCLQPHPLLHHTQLPSFCTPGSHWALSVSCSGHSRPLQTAHLCSRTRSTKPILCRAWNQTQAPCMLGKHPVRHSSEQQGTEKCPGRQK